MTDTEPTGEQILATPMQGGNDAHAETIGQYLRQLLAALWRDEEMFSGKRPFGNSGWQYDVYGALIDAGYVEGELYEDGSVEDLDPYAADALVQKAISAAFAKDAQ